ncbi:hypothetical protein A2716_03025 [candidate division WWE3 bacterium RIFCSPHIGHO2_01_FULL_40_23]|uniref:Uncharacterized protein n=1 Tax=candidate division WWE3 bacterium RIFCSPLOWO2_01_FULL_41_18 TaxID=1802625 RepID=A0A1F4VDN4_UNCKA|nr:MAG: hypothetical protein A2716_03025 [candidate division WWE3 bacterium RIFCSPHIGHO2_01_FULL_40_23]OGC54803.1 MAG: hypothetical protein A3A78_04980 [candidate division WWE3 bacterium RIFCSPLOWO2_01_FULL_41_18]
MKSSEKKKLIEYKEKYQNKWVALDPKTQAVLAADEDLKKLSNKMKKIGTNYILDKVLPIDMIFIP